MVFCNMGRHEALHQVLQEHASSYLLFASSRERAMNALQTPSHIDTQQHMLAWHSADKLRLW